MAWHPAATLNEIPPGNHKVLDIEGLELILFNLDGEYYCIENRCTHMDFPLDDGFIDSGEITCMHHGARFCIKSGKALCAPAFEAIPTFPVSIDGERILIALDD